MDSAASRKNWCAQCRAWYDEYAFHKVYHAVYDFATVDLSAVYFDVLEGPALYVRRRIRKPGAARRRRSTESTTRWCGCWRRCWASRPKKSGRTCEAEAPDSVHLALFPEPGELTAGIPDAAPATRRQIGTV